MSEVKFDVYIYKLPTEKPSFFEWTENLHEIPDATRLILVLDAVKEDACRKLLEIETLGGSGFLLPVIYRTPKIDIDEAKKLALEYLNEINKERKTNFQLSSIVSVKEFWWQFEIEGSVEGSPSIEVEFSDGHKLTFEEFAEWRKMADCD